ncbi:hypothetical protein BDD12DRAFT_893618 [Trichophaea hybrida]|nr:hypothetical protein BDD12DRAFT_893618 [Trichophaea hybrida]
MSSNGSGNGNSNGNSNGNGNGNSNGNSNGNGSTNGTNTGDRDRRTDYSGKELTLETISGTLINHVQKLRPGLLRFYDNPAEQLSVDSDHVKRGVPFANTMRQHVGQEGALGLAVLTLYDLVMLVDNSLSMTIEQGGVRIETLKRTMELVANVYTRATPIGEGKKGITAVKSLNSNNDYYGVTLGQIKYFFEYLTFEGTTPIGTVLNEKILKEFVTEDMKRPLLVIVITDGEVEGEPEGKLKTVIKQAAAQLQKVAGEKAAKLNKDAKEVKKANANGAQGMWSVSYQFAKLGDDIKATELVQKLDDDEELSPYIDCLLQSKLEDLSDKDKKWGVIQKLLLGAINRRLDKENSAAENAEEESEDVELGVGDDLPGELPSDEGDETNDDF